MLPLGLQSKAVGMASSSSLMLHAGGGCLLSQLLTTWGSYCLPSLCLPKGEPPKLVPGTAWLPCPDRERLWFLPGLGPMIMPAGSQDFGAYFCVKKAVGATSAWSVLASHGVDELCSALASAEDVVSCGCSWGGDK